MPGCNTGISDEQIIEIKNKLTQWGLLDPAFAKTGDPRIREKHSASWYSLCVSGYEKFLSLFGRRDTDGCPDQDEYEFVQSTGAPSPIKSSDRKTEAILSLYQKNDWYVARGKDSYNVLWVEDISRDWVAVKGTPDKWDDMVVLWQCEHSGTARIIEEYLSVTTEPGQHYTTYPINIRGAARIEFGQYKAWVRGMHGSGSTKHQGFRQIKPIRVCRDLNKDGSRVGDRREDGVFYCNWHSTIGSPSSVGRWSAGCSVFRYMSEFRDFMARLESDRRYQEEKSYAFIGAYCSGETLSAPHRHLIEKIQPKA